MSEKRKRLHWMPLDWPAYWADTRKWAGRPQLHGAYLNLLGALWMARGSLPLDDEELAALACCTHEQWVEMKDKILPMFDLVDGRLHQKRLASEFDHAQKVSEARSEAGKKGAAAKHGKVANAKDLPPDLPPDLSRQTDRQEQKQKHSPNGESLGASTDAPKKKAPKAKKDGYTPGFEGAWTIYPKRAGNNSKTAAYRAWCARLAAGATVAELTAGTERYALYCRNEGKIGSSYVKQASTFYGPDFHYLEPWDSAPRTATNSTRHDVRTSTMSGLGSKQGSHHETDRTHRTEPIDVQARVIPDTE